MTTQQKTIKGVIVFDVQDKNYKFVTYPEINLFEDGTYISDYFHYILVSEHDVDFTIPEGFDTVGPQLSALDAKEKELTLQYNQALHHIQVQRNNLLAIEHDANS